MAKRCYWLMESRKKETERILNKRRIDPRKKALDVVMGLFQCVCGKLPKGTKVCFTKDFGLGINFDKVDPAEKMRWLLNNYDKVDAISENTMKQKCSGVYAEV